MIKRKAIPKKIREQVKAKYHGHCGYCGIVPEKLQVDHIIPHARTHQQARKGVNLDAIENLMPSCPPCNNYKISYSLEEFRSLIGRQVELARKSSVNFRNAERFGLIEVKPQSEKIEFYFEFVDSFPKKSNYE